MSTKVLVAVAVLLALSFSCKRTELITFKNLSLQEKTKTIKDSFYLRNFDKKLIKPFSKNLHIQWEPEWEFLEEKPGKAQSFYFVPLKAKLLDQNSKPLPNQIHSLGYRSYLIISSYSNKLEYADAVYISADDKDQIKSDKEFFHDFTGKLNAKSLDYDRAYLYDYKNKIVSKAIPRTLERSISSNNTIAGGYWAQQCVTNVTCYWSASCRNTASGYYVTVTYGTDYYECGMPAPLTGNWLCWGNEPYLEYELYSTQVNQQCQSYWVEEPDSPGGGSGGGGDDNTDYSTVKIITDSLQSHPCAKGILDSAIKLNNDVSDIIKKVFKDSVVGNELSFVPKANLRDENGNKLEGRFKGSTVGTVNNYGSYKVKGTIYLDEDLLNYGSKEAILAVMLHEVLHAYLALEKGRLSDQAFSTKYPSISFYVENDPNSPLDKFYQFITTQNHGQMATNYRDAIETAIKQYNPNIPNDIAEALSMSGFFSPSSFPNDVVLKMNYEQDTRKINPNTNQPGFKGTKCP